MTDLATLAALLLSQIVGQTGDCALTPAALQEIEIHLRGIAEDVQHATAQRTVIHESPIPRDPDLIALVERRTRLQMIDIAAVIADATPVPAPDRLQKRTKIGMTEWFDHHWEIVKSLVPRVVLAVIPVANLGEWDDLRGESSEGEIS
jgi:hypothetical protein